jgi:multicomponent Na+:H+ antiporter subunit A
LAPRLRLPSAQPERRPADRRTEMMAALLALHGILGIALLIAAARLRRRAFLFGAVAPGAMLAWAFAQRDEVLRGGAVEERTVWVAGLGLDLDLRLDAFALLMIVLVSGIGALVFMYARKYFHDDARAGRAAGLLTLFAGSMTGLVLADNLLLLYVCWELTSITSYLLIGLRDRQEDARDAARQALLVTSLGGLAMLAGFVLLGQAAGTYSLSQIVTDPPHGGSVGVALVLVLVGAFTKSAQYPFHGWLPAAMVAPTPVSAYLHSAAMVKAGVYLVARLAPAFASVGLWRPVVVVIGLITMLAGGLRALRPFDLKQVLAFGTASQLGFMIVLFGIGTPEATAAGCALLLAHGLFKAALFMVVGIVDHQGGTRDLRRLVLGGGWTATKVVAVVSAASMAAIPPLAGFVAKEAAYEALLQGELAERAVLVGIVVGSVITVAYSARLVAAFTRPPLVAVGGSVGSPPFSPPSRSFVAPAAVLAVATLVAGAVPAVWNRLVDGAAASLDGAATVQLALWHGLSAALVLSVVTVAAGMGLFAARARIATWQARWAPRRSADGVYAGAVRGVNDIARIVTGIAQPGSLPVYAAIVLIVAAVVPGVALAAGSWWPGWPAAVDTAAYIPVAGLLIAGALAACVARRRFTSALLLGAVGYGMALIFVIQGAPDLALTQFTVETLSVVMFLLVLRRLPDRFERRSQAVGRSLRLGVATAVGLFVLAMAIASSGARTRSPVSETMVDLAEPEGGGRNVVNVILVDFRGLDTLGEITVLVCAAIGATALARAPRPRRSGPVDSTATTPPSADRTRERV